MTRYLHPSFRTTVQEWRRINQQSRQHGGQGLKLDQRSPNFVPQDGLVGRVLPIQLRCLTCAKEFPPYFSAEAPCRIIPPTLVFSSLRIPGAFLVFEQDTRLRRVIGQIESCRYSLVGPCISDAGNLGRTLPYAYVELASFLV